MPKRSKGGKRWQARRADPEDAQRGAERAERLAFERLLADLSVRFANVAHDRIVAEIEAALARLVDLLGYDRCTYTELATDGTLHVLCSAAVGGIEPLPRGPFGAGLPWLVGEIRAGRIVALSDLPHGLPPEATAEAEHVQRIGLRSHLSIPLRVGGRVVGALSFGGLRRARTWPEAVITRLTIVGEVFASAIARARSEDEAQRLRSQLWHADRVARTGALTAAIAHELNQPLAAILSNAQAGLAYLDRGEARPEEVRAILEAVVRDDKRAAETIRTMRALLRHDGTGRARIDIAAALREVLHLLEGELPPPGHPRRDRVRSGRAGSWRKGADRAGRAQPDPQRRRRDARVPAGRAAPAPCRFPHRATAESSWRCAIRERGFRASTSNRSSSRSGRRAARGSGSDSRSAA